MPGDPILVVDDNEFNTKLVEFILAAAGYVPLTAKGASEAEAILDRHRPRLILMDLHMPGVDGLELTRRLKSDPRTRGIIVIAFTTLHPDQGGAEARAAGCDGYITKPVDLRALPQQIEGYLQSGTQGFHLR